MNFFGKQAISFFLSVIFLCVTVFSNGDILLNDFYTSTYNEAAWGNKTNLAVVQTDLVPSGYAIQNTVGNIILSNNLSEDNYLDFTQHDYYVSLYYHMTGNVSTSTNTQHSFGFYNAVGTDVAKAGFITNSGYKPFVKFNGGIIYHGSGTVGASPVVTKDTVYQLIIKFVGGEKPTMLMNVYNVETGQLVASPGRDTGTTGTSSSTQVTRIAMDINSAWGGTQTLSDFSVVEFTDSTDKADALNVFKDSASIMRTFGTYNEVKAVSEISTDISALDFTPETCVNGSTVTFSSTNTDVIDNNGTVYPPEPGNADKRVFVIATVTSGGVSIQRAFAVTVKAQHASEDMLSLLTERDALESLYEGGRLPDSLPVKGSQDSDVTISWSSIDSGLHIDNNGNLSFDYPDAMEGRKQVELTAVLSKGTESIEKKIGFYIASSTGVIAYEDFNGLNNGGYITNSYIAPNNNGLKGTWKTSSTLSTPAEDTFFIEEISRMKLAKHITSNLTASLYNALKSPVDMDSNSVYYASWVQSFSNQGNNANKYLKVGFQDSGTNEISAVLIASTGTDSARVGIRAGNTTTYASDVYANSGYLYHVLFKIVAKSSGNDEVYLKVYPYETQEPKEWTHFVSSSLTGLYQKVFLTTSTALAGDEVLFGDFKVEQYVDEDAETISGIYDSVNDYLESGAPLSELNVPILNGVAHTSLDQMLQLNDKAYFGEVRLISDTERVYKLKNGGFSVQVTAYNDSSSEKNISARAYAVIYNKNTNVVEKVAVGDYNPTEEIASGESKTLTLPLGTINLDPIEDYYLEIFVWDSNIRPYLPVVTIDTVKMKNY